MTWLRHHWNGRTYAVLPMSMSSLQSWNRFDWRLDTWPTDAADSAASDVIDRYAIIDKSVTANSRTLSWILAVEKYSLVSFLFAVLLLTVPPPFPGICKSGGHVPPVPYGVGATGSFQTRAAVVWKFGRRQSTAVYDGRSEMTITLS